MQTSGGEPARPLLLQAAVHTSLSAPYLTFMGGGVAEAMVAAASVALHTRLPAPSLHLIDEPPRAACLQEAPPY